MNKQVTGIETMLQTIQIGDVRPRLRENVGIRRLPSNHLQVYCLTDSVTFFDPAEPEDDVDANLSDFILSCDGSCTIDEMCASLQGDQDKLREILTMLLQRGFLMTREPCRFRSANLDLAIIDFTAARARMAQTSAHSMGVMSVETTQGIKKEAELMGAGQRNRIALWGEGQSFDQLYAKLQEFGFDVVSGTDVCFEPDTDMAIDLAITVQLTPNRPSLRALNAQTNKAHIPLLIAINEGHRVILGPFVFPKESGCAACFLDRYYTTRAYGDEFLGLYGEGEDIHSPNMFGMVNSLLIEAHILQQAAQFREGVTADLLTNSVRMISIGTMVPETHPFLKVPRCSICSSAKPTDTRPAVRDML